MSRRSVLIRCSAPGTGNEDEIERWLARRVRAMAGDGAVLRRYTASMADSFPDEKGEVGAAWVVEVGAPGEPGEPGDAHLVSTLLGEMRMLGLDPALFRAGE